MSVYTSLFIRRCFNTCVSLYSLVLLILLNRVALLVLLFEFFSLSNDNGLGLSVRVKILTPTLELVVAHFHQSEDILRIFLLIYSTNINWKNKNKNGLLKQEEKKGRNSLKLHRN